MSLKYLKPNNALRNYAACILLALLPPALHAQDDEPKEQVNEPEMNPYPQNNLANCSSGANAYYLCPIINQGLSITPNGGTRTYFVGSAQQLYDVLSCLYQDWVLSDPQNPAYNCITASSSCSGIVPSCDNPIEIHLTQDINFSDLNPEVFPLELAPGVCIIGSYALGDIDVSTGRSIGTRVTFPYLYEGGKEPGIPPAQWYDGASPSCNMDGAFVFKLNDGCRITGICLEGPKPYMGDVRWYETYRDSCSMTIPYPPLFPPYEGMIGGILIFGNECEVSNNEIYGFTHSGILISDIVRASMDPLQPGGAVMTTPAPCFANGVNDKGRADIHHNYIHHCKSDGYGYGIYVGYRGSQFTFVSPPCTTGATNFYNYYYPDEEVYINNNIFDDNKCDIDGSGGRLNIYIDNNTFGSRTLSENIHFHNAGGTVEASVCNPMAGVIPQWCMITLQPSIFSDVGLNYLQINNNAFYRLSANLNLLYPNINPTPASPSYNYSPPGINIYANHFATRDYIVNAHPLGNGSLDWDAWNCLSGMDGISKITLRDRFFHYDYLYKITPNNPSVSDDNIQIDEGTPGTPQNICATTPFDVGSETPVAIITSVTDKDLQQGAFPDPSNKIINQGETVWFSSAESTDKNGTRADQSPNLLINIWRWNDQTNELATEFRTNNSPVLTPHQFNEMGITRVNLTTMDLSPTATNNWRASNITSQRITVAPNVSENTWLSFWIRDTYVGSQLFPLPVFACSTCTHGHEDIVVGLVVDETETGFRKFARFSTDNGATWRYVWTDDIAGNEGWQHVTVVIAHDGAPDEAISAGILEIGIESVMPVDAERIRGVSVYIDDVYINNREYGNVNAIANGDFEEHNPPDVGAHPDVWHYLLIPHALDWTPEFNWPGSGQSPFSNMCDGNTPIYNDQSLGLSNEEVHSGSWAYRCYVRNIQRNVYSPWGVTYAPNQIYKSIRQAFDLSQPPPPKS